MVILVCGMYQHKRIRVVKDCRRDKASSKSMIVLPDHMKTICKTLMQHFCEGGPACRLI